MNEHDYLLAWGAYLGAGLGLTLVWFLMTGWMWRWLREPLRVIVIVLLFTPTPVDPANNMYAPAIAITALDIVFKVGNNAWRAVSDLALVLLAAFGVYLLFVLIRWPIERALKKRRKVPEPDDEPTLRQLMQPELMPDVDTRTDERGDRRMRIEPRL
ncbi:MFS transporter [Pseudomonas sp. SCB32]|uniref:MFS transporter n=1 Tax=Pseudomonas sp. SCB32 TaxID=2653853 RepID=UPI001265602C|nr:MFS transporter [Pseudomonas sp. SCB32]